MFPGLNSRLGLSVRSLKVLHVLVWVFARYSHFLLQCKDIDLRLTGDHELAMRVRQMNKVLQE